MFSTSIMVKPFVISDYLIFFLRKDQRRKSFAYLELNLCWVHILSSHQQWGVQDRHQVPKSHPRKCQGYQPREYPLCFQRKWAWVEYQEPGWRAGRQFEPIQEKAAVISYEWLKFLEQVTWVKLWCKTYLEILIIRYFFLSYFLSLNVSYS